MSLCYYVDNDCSVTRTTVYLNKNILDIIKAPISTMKISRVDSARFATDQPPRQIDVNRSPSISLWKNSRTQDLVVEGKHR